MLFRVIRKKMEFLTKKIDDGQEFKMSPAGYPPNTYVFINGSLYIKSSFSGCYVIAYISINDILDENFKVHFNG